MGKLFLTIGKLYSVRRVGRSSVVFINDRGVDLYYDESQFISVSDFREYKIDLILSKNLP